MPFAHPFQNYVLGVTLHPYQQQALTALEKAQAHGKQRLHLVAPPGAGKTILGLEFARRRGQRTLVLSPNATLQRQWAMRAGELLMDPHAESEPPPESWMEPVTKPPPLLSLTYQAFSVQTPDGELHANVHTRFAWLQAQGYTTLILDECHHLLAHWGRVVAAFLELQPDTCVLGLTATPPVDRAEVADYLALVGAVDWEIPVPAVIRQGYLAPFQDLVWLVRPTEAETQFVTSAHDRLHHVLAALETAPAGLEPLPIWAESWLLEPIDNRGRPIARERLLDRHADRTIALVRFLLARGLTPIGLPWLPEMEEPFQLSDLVLLLGAYGAAVLAPLAHPLWPELQAALGELGYNWRQGQFSYSGGAVDRVLALSAAKRRAVTQIVSHEAAVLGSELRTLILTDFETTHGAGGRASDVLDPEAGGAVGVLRQLNLTPEIQALKPVLVTGQRLMSLAVDHDEFLWRAERWYAQQGKPCPLVPEPTEGLVLWRGATSSEAVAMATEWLQTAWIHCLVGTRGLFAEGWDCSNLNTLIDLTGVATYVSVNQIRGRSLRLGTQGLKVANNWDVVAVVPELEGGWSDLERFLRKHHHFYGLSDDGCLEKGPGHVHAIFSRPPGPELLAALDALNTEMLRRAQERAQAWTDWGVGKPYRGQDLPCVQLRPDTRRNTGVPRSIQRLPAELPVARQAREHTATLWVKTTRLQQGASLGLAIGATVLLQSLAMPLGSALVAGLLLTLGLEYGLQVRLRHWQTYQPEDAWPLALARSVLRALQEAELVRPELEPSHIYQGERSGGALRLYLDTELVSEAEAFAAALEELFLPIQDPRYLVALEISAKIPVRRWGLTHLKQGPVQRCWLPVPKILARSRTLAEQFAEALRPEIGQVELLYTRQGEGKAQLTQLYRASGWGRVAQHVTLWR
jgi:superfamily II DNA or RNA helicase